MKNNIIFYILIICSLTICLSSIWENSQPLPPPSPYPTIDVEAVRAKLEKAGIDLYPAQYWDTLNQEKLLHAK